MPNRPLFFFLLVSGICSISLGDDHYTLHENLHFGQKIRYSIDQTTHTRSVSTTQGNKTVTDTTTGQHWKVTLTVYGVKDGSASREVVLFDPDSYDTVKNGERVEKVACPFAGKTIILTRSADGTVANSFPGKAGNDDVNSLNSIIDPDADFYPDDPVAVGDVWDNSAKFSRDIGITPPDRVLSKCRLDWVKTVGGRQMAQISNSVGVVYHEDGNVEEDMGYSGTVLVDVAAGMIVKGDASGSSKYLTPPTEATQVTGGVEFSFHSAVLPPVPEKQ
jgi:hypothetical protein